MGSFTILPLQTLVLLGGCLKGHKNSFVLTMDFYLPRKVHVIKPRVSLVLGFNFVLSFVLSSVLLCLGKIQNILVVDMTYTDKICIQNVNSV